MKVIVVCDEPFVTSTISAILGRSGCIIESVGSASAAERLTRDPPDLAIIDWLLEDVDGTTLVRSLRKCFGPSPAVLLMSPLTEDAARSHAKRIGVDEYLTKPLSEDLLLKAVARRGPKSAPSSVSAFTPTQRALFVHDFWSKFEIHAAKHASDFLGTVVEGTVSAKPLQDTGGLTASLSMYDLAALLEVEVTLECSRATGTRVARPLFRGTAADEDTIREMLTEMCNTILGRAKGAFRMAGFRFTTCLPKELRTRGECPVSKRGCLTGSFGTLHAVLGARPFRTAVVRSSELRENMVLAEDVKTDLGEIVYAAGTRLTPAAVDRLVRHLALRPVRVSMVGS